MNTSINFRLMFLNPKNFWRSKAGERIVPGGSEQIVPAHSCANLIALRSTALVVPKYGRPKNVADVVQQNEPVHLARQADGRDGIAGYAGLVECARNAVRSRLPPVFRILLRPECVRRRKAERCGGAADYLTFIVNEQRFGSGG